MSKELAKTYDPGIEDRLYQKWLDKSISSTEVDHSKTPSLSSSPAPNI